MINQDIKEYKSLYEESWDLFGQLVLDQDVERVISVLENDESISQEADHFYHEFDTVNCNRIKHFIKKSRLRKWINQYIPHAVRMVVMILGMMALGIGIAAAANTSVRLYLARLIVDVTPEYTTLWVEKTDELSLNVPKEWTGKYFPGTVPDGYVVRQVFSGTGDKFISFYNPEKPEQIFAFYEMSEGRMNIDTEDSIIQEVRINGINGQVSLKNGYANIYWLYEDTLMMISVKDCSSDMAVYYAENVKKIQGR